jgi:acetate kinase
MPAALILNAGSATLKWSVLAADGAEVRAGSEDWAGADAGARAALVAGRLGGGDFAAVGHRVVHGGARFRAPVVLDPTVRAALDEVVPLDRLHMAPALAAVDAVSAAFPTLPQVLAFDTAFHATLPPAARGYGLPDTWGDLPRYGFHGLSVEWAVGALAGLCSGALPARVIVAHLGSGCSVTAVADGRSLDTSMGFSPLEGIVMATRSGSVDPGLLLHLILERGVAPAALADTLARGAGLLGLSGVSGDLRLVLAAADAGDARAQLAYQRFVWSLRRALGAAAGVLGGVDAVVFTGGIGEHSARVRADAATALPSLELGTATDGEISTPASRVRAFVVRAREDVVILRAVAGLLGW